MPKTENQVEILLDLILHEGILTYNPKSSDAPAELQRCARQLDKIHKKGAVFAVRQKSDFGQGRVKGYIVTSKETLVKQAETISHYTPNVYRNYAYASNKRTYIKGFEETNLQQVNTFVVDIDTKTYSVNDILLACIDESIGEPTAILETDQGYHVYFVLSEPIYISNQKRFLSLHVAKRIADNLKRSLQSVKADMYCNDFGFFRMPNSRNIVWLNEYATYTPKQMMDWSQRKDDDKNRKLYVVNTKKQSSMLTSEWMQLLLSSKDVKGEKGQIGRNNLLFTLALACLKDGRDEDYAYDLLDQFNSNLMYPLSIQEVIACVKSAYSGRYFGPKKEYVEQLIELYVPHASNLSLSFGQPKWYKHKKAREDRERSHLSEWEEDIGKWIAAQKSACEPFIWCTQKELCEQVGLASSSLNKLLKQSKKLLKTTTGKGRYAKTGWTTVDLYMEYIIWLKKDRGTRYAEAIQLMIDEHLASLEPVAGYAVIVAHVKKLRQQRPEYYQLSLTGVG